MSEIKEIDINDAESIGVRLVHGDKPEPWDGTYFITPKVYDFMGDDAKEKGDKFISLVKEKLAKLTDKETIIFWRMRPELLSNKDFDRNITEFRWVARFATWPPLPVIQQIHNSLNSPKAES